MNETLAPFELSAEDSYLVLRSLEEAAVVDASNGYTFLSHDALRIAAKVRAYRVAIDSASWERRIDALIKKNEERKQD